MAMRRVDVRQIGRDTTAHHAQNVAQRSVDNELMDAEVTATAWVLVKAHEQTLYFVPQLAERVERCVCLRGACLARAAVRVAVNAPHDALNMNNALRRGLDGGAVGIGVVRYIVEEVAQSIEGRNHGRNDVRWHVFRGRAARHRYHGENGE